MIQRILFVCTGNTCRSAMAEALFRKMLQDELGEAAAAIEVLSAGTWTFDGSAASPNAITVMAEAGIDLSGHRSRQITTDLLQSVDLILTMTEEQKEDVLQLAPTVGERLFTLIEFATAVNGLEDSAENDAVSSQNWPASRNINDPYGLSVADYRDCAAEIRGYLELVLQKIKGSQRGLDATP